MEPICPWSFRDINNSANWNRDSVEDRKGIILFKVIDWNLEDILYREVEGVKSVP